MLTKLLAFVARLAVGKQLLGALDTVNRKLSGHRTEILLGLLTLTYSLEKFGVAPAGTYDGIAPLVYGALPVTVAEKVTKAKALADKTLKK